MVIKETPINEFNTKLVYKSNKYPQCSCGKCFKLFWNGLFVAARNSGKTYCMSRIIKHYEENKIVDDDGNKYKVRTIIISPTYEQNKVFTSLKSIDEDNDVYSTYNDTMLEEIINDVDAKTEVVKEYNKYQKVYSKFLKLKSNELHKLDDEELYLLNKNNFENDIEKPPMYITFLVLDDMLGGNAFTSSKKSKLMNYFIKNRHHGICFMVAVQSMRAVPREIRLNSNVIFLGKFASAKIITEDAYEEVSNCITLSGFMDLYKHAVKDKYGSLIVDLSNDDKRFMKSLDCVLDIEDVSPES